MSELNVIDKTFDNVLLLEPTACSDARGFFMEIIRNDIAPPLNTLERPFIQLNHSHSDKAGTVRGLHWQLQPHEQAKLIRVTRGAIFDVVVDVRRQSKSFGLHSSFIISDANRRALYVPAGFAHGFCTLTDSVDVLYAVDAYYAPDAERGLRWNDPRLGIRWPVTAASAIISVKDNAHPNFDEVFK